MPQLQTYTTKDIRQYTRLRAGETKLGEKIGVADFDNEDTRYVLLGVPEDIGIKANFGVGGAHTAWPAFLQSFLNVQATARFQGSNICLLGHIDCSDLMDQSNNMSIAELRAAVELIDQEVEQTIIRITSAGKLPIVIGGGHNNAFPIMAGAAKGWQINGRIDTARINCINLDTHTDFRAMEGRHSGNGFRYAFTAGFLEHYALPCLHRNYNAQHILDEIVLEPRIQYQFWESIFLEEKMTFKQAIEEGFQFTAHRPCGIELDLDCLENILSSALSPSGLPVTAARQFVHLAARRADVAYLHICEGAAQLQNGLSSPTTGKLIAYLVSDFIRSLDDALPDQ